jgi:predicted RNA-binding protein YlqC (UPF0109 family)
MKTEPDPNSRIDEIADILSDLVKSVVRNPDSVKISHVARGPLVAFAIKTDQDDVRRVIGQRGKHFRALETICKEGCRSIGVEAHIAIDEDGRNIPQPAAKGFVLGDFSARKFKNVKELLKRSCSLFLDPKSSVAVAETPVANMMILEIKIKKSDYPLLYGRDAAFDYGTDGHIIGAIKNFFDGIGKNNGRIIKIGITQL